MNDPKTPSPPKAPQKPLEEPRKEQPEVQAAEAAFRELEQQRQVFCFFFFLGGGGLANTSMLPMCQGVRLRMAVAGSIAR